MPAHTSTDDIVSMTDNLRHHVQAVMSEMDDYVPVAKDKRVLSYATASLTVTKQALNDALMAVELAVSRCAHLKRLADEIDEGKARKAKGRA